MSDLDLDHRHSGVADAGLRTEPPTDAVLSPAALSRRAMLRGAGAVTLGAVAAGALAACSSTETATTAVAASGGATMKATPGGSAAAASLAKVADIPVGGAISAKNAAGKPIILSQPTAGTIVGLSAICTHLGCTVAPAGAELKCPCHGSVFKAADGSNVSGPASKPLPAVVVHVENGQVLEG